MPLKKAKSPKALKKAIEPLQAASAAVRDWPLLEVFSEGNLSKARKAVRNQFGAAFASKATDRFCQALTTVQSFALESVAPQPRPTILECSSGEVSSADVKKRATTLAGIEKDIPPMVLRLAKRHLLRDAFIKSVSGIATQLEKKARPLFPAGLEAMA